MSRMWYRYGLVMALLLFMPLLGSAQQLDTTFTQTSPPAPVGSGARAMGTGGAFIAIGDDATSANWNPGAMVQLIYPEASVVLSAEGRDVGGDEDSFNAVNHASLVYPFSVEGLNVVTGVSYQRLYDFYFTAEASTTGGYNYIDQVMVLDPTMPVVEITDVSASYPLSVEQVKDGSLEALTPSIAFQITPQFSLGFSYNFWDDDWMGSPYKQTYNEVREEGTRYQSDGAYFVDGDLSNCTCNGGEVCDSNGDIIDDPSCMGGTSVIAGSTGVTVDTTDRVEIRGREEIDMEGQNFTIGFLWEATPQWSIGGVYRSEFELDMERKLRYEYIGFSPPRSTSKRTYDEKMRMPASYGLGVAYRYNDELSFAFDATRIEWDRFELELDDGSRISPVNGLPEDEADIDPTTTYRLGGEYLLVQPKYVVPFRMGFFYDPQPAREDPDEYYGIAGGTGLVYEHLVFDLAYWYKWGNDVTLYTNYNKNTGAVEEVEGDVVQRMVMLSLIVHVQ